MSIMDLNEQELFRRESLAKLRELGIEPYPAALCLLELKTLTSFNQYLLSNFHVHASSIISLQCISTIVPEYTF